MIAQWFGGEAMGAERATRRSRAAFTLIETAIAVVVVGVGIMALLQAMASGTRINTQARNITLGVFLAQEVREWTLRLPFRDNPADPNLPYHVGAEAGENPQVDVNDLDDLKDVPFTPPRDGEGQAITELAAWSQTVRLQWRDPNDLTARKDDGTTNVVCVSVDVKNNNQLVHTASWIVTRR
jgi:Tfp pilus assembly protein PilV